MMPVGQAYLVDQTKSSLPMMKSLAEIFDLIDQPSDYCRDGDLGLLTLGVKCDKETQKNGRYCLFMVIVPIGITGGYGLFVVEKWANLYGACRWPLMKYRGHRPRSEPVK